MAAILTRPRLVNIRLQEQIFRILLTSDLSAQRGSEINFYMIPKPELNA